MSAAIGSSTAVQEPVVRHDLAGLGGRAIDVYLCEETSPGTKVFAALTWILPSDTAPVLDRITRPFDTVLYFMGTDPHERSLGATVEVSIGDTKHTLTKTSVCFVPAGTPFGGVSLSEQRGPTLFGILGVGTADFETKIEGAYDEFRVNEPVVTEEPFRLLEAEGHDFGDDGYIKNHTCPDEIYLAGEITPDFPHFMDLTWFWDVPYPNPHVLAHRHEFDEIVMFIAAQPDGRSDLDGEIMFYLDEDPHFLTKTSAMFIPEGLKHAPMIHTRVDRPHILLTLCAGTGRYAQ